MIIALRQRWPAAVTALALTTLLASCVTKPTTSKRKKTRSTPRTSEPVVANTTETQPKSAPMPLPQSTKQRQTPYYEDLIAMVTRHAMVKDSLDSNERTLMAQLPERPDPGSLEEAAIILAAAKLSLDGSDVPSVIANSSPSGNDLENMESLEKACTSRDINLVRALNTNPILRSASVHRLIADALLRSKDSAAFAKDVRSAIKAQAEQWQILSTDQSLFPEAVTTAPAPAMISAADLRSGDALLMEAQALANQSRYQDAVNRLSLIPEGNPLYPQAQERVKAFSNRAVSDLRQKAAQAFQSSLPVGDAKAKLAYLQQAQRFLEDALNQFPAADHLPTVRENLSVITQDLMELQSQLGSAN